MNRRSMFKAAVGACAAMLFPWRKMETEPLHFVAAINDAGCLVEVAVPRCGCSECEKQFLSGDINSLGGLSKTS